MEVNVKALLQGTRTWMRVVPFILLMSDQMVVAQSSPHVVWGRVLNSKGVAPGSDSFMFYAFIKSRPGEILTHKSVGSGYSDTEGIWYLNTGNFESGWQVGDTLVIELLGFDGQSSIERKLVEGRLTGAGNDYFGQHVLEPVPHLTDQPLPVELADFTATLKNRKVELRWRTLSERNNSGFRIERALENQA